MHNPPYHPQKSPYKSPKTYLGNLQGPFRLLADGGATLLFVISKKMLPEGSTSAEDNLILDELRYIHDTRSCLFTVSAPYLI